jgi:hypothetical protein
MSKLSVHISSGNRSGFSEWLQKCAEAGSPIGIVYSVNENISGDITQHSPSTKWVYRYQTEEFSRLPDGFFEGDPVKNATEWLTKTKDSRKRTLIQNWKLNQADWFDPLNEPVPDIPVKAQWLNQWMLKALEIANDNGFRLALFSMPTGGPPIDMWQLLVPALQRGKELGAILSLHAYWETDQPETEEDNALRHRKIYATLPDDAQLPLVMSEASPGNGYDVGWRGQAWVDNMARYDAELMKDAYVLGACGFQLGGQESNLRSVLPQYAAYIAKTLTPAIIPTDDHSNTDTSTLIVSDPDVRTSTPPADTIVPPTDITTPPIDTLTTPPPTDTITPPADTTTTLSTVSSGPLDFEIQAIKCRKDSGRPNGIIVTIQINATGGSGVYTYSHEGETLSGAVYDRLATKSGAMIDSYRVQSSDGQVKEKKVFLSPKDLDCR